MLISVHNRGPEAARIHLLPQLWFRNTWSWKTEAARPELSAAGTGRIRVRHAELGEYHCSCDGSPALLFCDNDTNVRRHFGERNAQGYFKDAFHDYLMSGIESAVNP